MLFSSIDSDCLKLAGEFFSVVDVATLMSCGRAANVFGVEVFLDMYGRKEFAKKISGKPGARHLGKVMRGAWRGRMMMKTAWNIDAMIRNRCLVCKKNRAPLNEYGLVAHVKCMAPYEVRMKRSASPLASGSGPKSDCFVTPEVVDRLPLLVSRTTWVRDYCRTLCLEKGVPGIVPDKYCLEWHIQNKSVEIRAMKEEVEEEKKRESKRRKLAMN
jgi:hypothetical protein